VLGFGIFMLAVAGLFALEALEAFALDDDAVGVAFALVTVVALSIGAPLTWIGLAALA